MSSGKLALAHGCRFSIRPSLILLALTTLPLFSDVDMRLGAVVVFVEDCMMCRCWPSTGDLGPFTEIAIGCCGCCWLRACDDVRRALWFYDGERIKRKWVVK